MNDAGELLQEGQELAAAYGAAILRLDEDVREGRPTGPACAEAFRAVHTLKSIAAFAQLPELSQVAAVTEEALSGVREGRTHLGDALFGLLLAAEALMTEGIAGGSGQAEARERVAAWSEAMTLVGEAQPAMPPPASPETDKLAASLRAMLSASEAEDLRVAMRTGAQAYLWERTFGLLNLDTELENARARSQAHAHWIALLPAEGHAGPMDLCLAALLVSALTLPALATALGCPESELKSATEPRGAPIHAAAYRSAPAAEPAAPTLRVHIEVLDTMLAELGALSREGANRAVRMQHVDCLRDALLSARSVEMSLLYDRLTRATRQASLELGKPVRLSTHGGELKLDKRLADSVFEPLLHIVHNALDHGIESPAIRLARGKEESGRVVLTAFTRTGGFAIEVEDDGEGVNLEALRMRAAAAGVVSVATARAASDEECLSWAFLPGLSTREDVTRISGRGVGLDAVRTKVRAVGGQVELRSVQGVGTKITLYVPRHASVMRVAQVQSGYLQVDVPLDQIRSAKSIACYTERVVAGERLLSDEDERFFALSLKRILRQVTTRETSPENLVLRMHSGQRAGAVLVASPIQIADILLHPLGAAFDDLPGALGVGERRDGSLSLVLDHAVGMKQHEAPRSDRRHDRESVLPAWARFPLAETVGASAGPVVALQRGACRLHVPAAGVREVTAAHAWTPVPHAPWPVVGATLARGRVVPVLEFADAREQDTDSPPTVLVHLHDAYNGLVLACDSAEFHEAPHNETTHSAMSLAEWVAAAP